jgi:hypothetical protein
MLAVSEAASLPGATLEVDIIASHANRGNIQRAQCDRIQSDGGDNKEVIYVL